MTSQSFLGNTQITVQFDLNRSLDGAALDIQTALSTATPRLPKEMTFVSQLLLSSLWRSPEHWGLAEND